MTGLELFVVVIYVIFVCAFIAFFGLMVLWLAIIYNDSVFATVLKSRKKHLDRRMELSKIEYLEKKEELELLNQGGK
jgi:hypothetical protein